jgi:hypothetical protein
MRVEYHPLADQELSAAAVFYGSQASGLGAEFLDEVLRSETFVTEYPFAGRELGPGLRRFPLRRFPHDLIYELRDDVLWILAVAHQRRRPGYWQDRQSSSRAR